MLNESFKAIWKESVMKKKIENELWNCDLSDLG